MPAVFGGGRDRERGVELARWAAMHGWRYVGEDPALLQRWRDGPFPAGRGKIRHAMAGSHRGTHQALAFEYRTRSGPAGGQSVDIVKTVVAIGTPAPRPVLQIQPAVAHTSLFGRTLHEPRNTVVGFEPFDRAFAVVTGDPRFSRDVLVPAMMQWLLGDGRSRTLPLRFEGADLLTWVQGKLSVPQVGFLADYLTEALGRVPAEVW